MGKNKPTDAITDFSLTEIDAFSALIGQTLVDLKQRPILRAGKVVNPPVSGRVEVQMGDVTFRAPYFTSCGQMVKGDEVRVLQLGASVLVIGVMAK